MESYGSGFRRFHYKALPEALIDKVRIDVGMKVGDTIRVADLDIAKAKNVDLVTDFEYNRSMAVAVVHGDSGRNRQRRTEGSF